MPPTALRRALRVLHTLRHLRREQLVGQVRHRLRQRFADPSRHPAAAAPTAGSLARCPHIDPAAPAQLAEAPNPQGSPNDAAAIRRGRFTFVNQGHDLGFPPADWQAPGTPKLWQYNLHYHEWFHDLPFADSREAALHWIRHHGLAKGALGWEAYPTSLRLQNWCALFFGRHRAETLADRGFADALWRSIVQQATWLEDRLEWHLMGNHLLENAIALTMVGGVFEGSCRSVRPWLEDGLDLLRGQLEEQILPDGMHFELSPMYHVRVSYGLMLLLALGHPDVDAIVRPHAERVLRPLALLRHPDGDIPLFGDSAIGIYPRPGLVLDWAERLGLERPEPGKGPWVLPDAGYVGYLRSDRGDAFLADLGGLGPDHVPGHAHGDFGTWEASVRGERVIVDAGIGVYEPGTLRSFVRSVASHNTIEVEGVDQGEFWGVFRLGRRGRVLGRPIVSQRDPEIGRLFPSEDPSTHVFEGAFRYPDRTLHMRVFKVTHGFLHSVEDVVLAHRPRRCVWRMRLERGWSLQRPTGPSRAFIDKVGPVSSAAFQGLAIPEGDQTLRTSRAGRGYGEVRESEEVCISRRGEEVTFELNVLPPGIARWEVSKQPSTRDNLLERESAQRDGKSREAPSGTQDEARPEGEKARSGAQGAGRQDGRAGRPLKILFFSHYFPPEGNAPANRTYHHCKVWSEMGHEVTVVTCAPNCPDGVIYEGYENRWVQREMVDGIEVLRIWTYIAANKGFARRTLNYVSYLFSAVWRSLRLDTKPDVIIATSPQFFCAWAGAISKWLLRRPFVLEIRDIWPESIAALGAMRKGLLYRLLERLEGRLYATADRIVTVGEGYRRRIYARLERHKDVAVVPNGFDEDLLKVNARDAGGQAPVHDSALFTVAYVGTVGMAAGLDVVVRAARLLLDEGVDDVRFVIVGSGATLERLRASAQRARCHTIEFTGRLNRSEAVEHLRAASCALVHLRPLDLFRSVIPSKIVESAALGIPVLLGVSGDSARLVSEMGCGLIFEPDDERGLARAILKLKDDPDSRLEMGRRGKEFVETRMSRRLMAERMLAIVGDAAPATDHTLRS